MSRPEYDFFEVDPEQLDEQWFVFPREYAQHAYALADARQEFERAKAKRDVIEAEIDKEIRLEPEKFGISKITETIVAKTVQLHKRFRKAEEEVIIAKHSLDIHQATVDAMDVKKKGLEVVVQLRLASYYAEPKARGEAREEMREAELKQLRRVGQTQRNR